MLAAKNQLCFSFTRKLLKCVKKILDINKKLLDCNYMVVPHFFACNIVYDLNGREHFSL